MDSLVLYRLVEEYQKWVGCTIRHVQQLNADTISLKISSNLKRTGQLASTTNHHLLISAHAVHARTHILTERPISQKQSHFAEFLFRHLSRGKITSIEQVGWDRIIKITVQPYNEFLPVSPKTLIVELMGKHSNIVLVDQANGQILECIKHIDHSMSRVRIVEPGEQYQLPPQFEKADPLSLDFQKWTTIFGNSKPSWQKLMKAIDGISPIIAKEILHRAIRQVDECKLVHTDLEIIWTAFDQVRLEWAKAKIEPQIISNGEKSFVSIIALQQLDRATYQSFDTISEALSVRYKDIEQQERKRRESQALLQAVKRRQQSVERKLYQLWEDRENAENADIFRKKGELLKANLHQIKPGQNEVKVIDYYDPDLKMLKLKLNPELSPTQNTKRLFKLYNKAKKGKTVIQQLIADNEAELEVIDYYQIEVESAETAEELLSIRTQLASKGWISDKQKSKKRREANTFRRYTSPEGFQIYVGRNSVENDLLLRRVAKSDDMWLHARQINGSHVIIRNPERKPGIPMPTLLMAAQLAASNCKAKHSSYVPIDYTWFKYVTKRRGIGFVHYTHQKTLNVEPKSS